MIALALDDLQRRPAAARRRRRVATLGGRLPRARPRRAPVRARARRRPPPALARGARRAGDDRRAAARRRAARARLPRGAGAADRAPARGGQARRPARARPGDDPPRGDADARLAGLDARRPTTRCVLLRAHGGMARRRSTWRRSRCGAQPDPHRAVARFGGDDRLAADYLRDELLDRLDAGAAGAPALRVGARRARRGPPCDALLGRRGSGDAAAAALALERARRPARQRRRDVPLPSDARAACCAPSCGRADPERERVLHRRASAWYAEAGRPRRAIAHAIDAGRRGRARAAAVVGGGRATCWTAAAPTSGAGSRSSTPSRIAPQPALALTAAACHLAAGERDLAEHWADAAERGARRARRARAAARRRRADARRRSPATASPAMDADAARAYALAAEDSPWRSLCCLLRGVAAHLRGDRERGARAARGGRAARRDRRAARPGRSASRSSRCSRSSEDDWEQAPLLASRAMAQVERRELADDPACALVFAVSALVRAHRDRVEHAQADRRRATELLAALVDYVAVVRGRDARRARPRRAAARRRARARGRCSPRRRARLAAARRPAGAPAAGSTSSARSSRRSRRPRSSARRRSRPPSCACSRCCRRTCRSARWAARLHVSANTIKTHAHAVYRKLDVCSRSEAVLRARETGLLDVPTKEEPPCPSS